MDPLILSLGVLWLNGVVDCLILGLVALGLVSGAPNGKSLGHMTPLFDLHIGGNIPLKDTCLLFWSPQKTLLASFQHNALSPRACTMMTSSLMPRPSSLIEGGR